MNAFFQHHQHSIAFQYRCFDRILLNGLIQPFQQPERVIGFFNTYRQGQRVTRAFLTDIADQFRDWITQRARKWGVPILDAPEGRRDDFVDSYFRRPKPNEIVVILKAREPARILIANGNRKDDRWHLEIRQRWVNQYNIYLQDAQWGRLFVRICPYFPFSARVCLNQHSWLARRLHEDSINFRQCSNAFLRCANPQRLQELADSLTAQDLLTCGQKWLTYFTPFFTTAERQQAGCHIACSLPRSSIATISSSAAALAWTLWKSASWTPIAPSASLIRSPPSLAARSASATAASCRR
jgi:hypothetical protein